MAKKKGHSTTGKKKKKGATKVVPLQNGVQGFPKYFYNVKLLSIKLFLISCLLYVGTLGHEFTQDDAIVITQNDFTKEGDIASLLKYDTFRGFFKVEGKENLVAGGRYRPLTPVMFALGWKITQNPMWFHLMSMLWYGVLVVVLFRVLLQLLKNEYKPYAFFVAFVTALVYAIHPVHTEVVANIKGLDEIMTLLLGLGAFFFTLKAVDTQKMGVNLALSGLLFFLALMAKEMAIVLVPIMWIALYIFRKIDIKSYVIQTIPYTVSFLVFMLLRGQAIGSFLVGGNSATPILEPMNNPFIKWNGTQYVAMDFQEKFGTIFYTLGKYIQLLVFPHTLTHDYYPYSIPVSTFSDGRVFIALLLYMGLIALGAWGVWKRKHWAWGIAFFLISLFLVSNLLFPIGVNMAERFMFVPSVGFAFVVAILLYELSKRVGKINTITSYMQFKPAMLILAGVFLFSSFKTVTRSLDWENNFTLFHADWKKSENSAKIRNAMGGELTTRSQDKGTKGTAKEKQMLQEALTHLDVATQIHPHYKGAYLLKGNANFHLGNYDTAVQNYNIALQIDPNFADAQKNLGIAQQAKNQNAQNTAALQKESKGIQASQNGNFAEAERIFSELNQQYPNEPKYDFFIGLARLNAGNLQGALESFLSAERKDPKTDINNTHRIYNAIADAYTRLGDTANAAAYRAKIAQ